MQEIVNSTATANMLTVGMDNLFTRTDSNGAWSALRDALGSTIALTDSSGTTQTEYSYDPFGSTISTGATNNNPSQYTGRENDGTGLYYYRARYYSPAQQRFISADPIGFASGDTNLYGFVVNDPVNLIDPSGLDPIWKPLPGEPGAFYREDMGQQPRPNMHVKWPDGSESVISDEGGWLRTHGGKPCALPPRKYRPALRKVVGKFVRKAARIAGPIAIIALVVEGTFAAQEVSELSGRKDADGWDYVKIGIDHLSPIGPEELPETPILTTCGPVLLF